MSISVALTHTANEVKSETIDNNIGIPQGAILAAILFILYINDMPKIMKHTSIKLFADDTLLYIAGKDEHNMEMKLKSDLQRIERYLRENKLKLNASKTQYMHIKSNNTESTISIEMDTIKIQKVNKIKYLGIIVDDKLKFNKNTTYVNKKVARKINMLQRISKHLTKDAKLQIYKSVVAPHFDYCATLLFLANKQQMDSLQKQQNRALRIILKRDRRENVKKNVTRSRFNEC